MSVLTKKCGFIRRAGVVSFLALLMFLPVLTTCDMPMGMGDTVDLEPPTLTVTTITLPDGSVIPVQEEDNKLFIGPGILVGPGATLSGTAYDNVAVTRIYVEEIGSNAQLVNGVRPSWSSTNITQRQSAQGGIGGLYEWSIVLEGIKKGERTISITAFDAPGNIGPLTVKQLTLLVDTDPPFIDNIKIVRGPGIEVELLPRTALDALDSNLFENIDYFQNEGFTIRAAVNHDFSLDDVGLNFLDDENKLLFSQNMPRKRGSLYAPEWEIKAQDLEVANDKYRSGRHYINVVITAKALAGHSGQTNVSNMMFSFCWYPEMDNPQTKLQVGDGSGASVLVEKDSRIPVTVFDDDNLKEVYAGLIPSEEWDKLDGRTDEEKAELFYASAYRNYIGDQYKDLHGNSQFRTNLTTQIRNTVVSVLADFDQGQYKYLIVAKDNKIDDDKAWGYGLYDIHIIEEGVPIIQVERPLDNTAPELDDGRFFDMKGFIVNLDKVEFIRIAWVPDGLGWTGQQKLSNGKAALTNLENKAGTLANGIKIWEPELTDEGDEPINGKQYKKQSFDQPFDIYTDFMLNREIENRQKLFILYATGAGEDVFYTINIMSYTQGPKIIFDGFTNFQEFKPRDEIQFVIKAFCESGIEVESVTLASVNEDSKNIPLTKGADGLWRGTNRHEQMGDYQYIATATDKMRISTHEEIFIKVTDLPSLVSITSQHNIGTTFSGRENITIQAVFSGRISQVSGIPRIRLSIENESGSAINAYANYVSGEGSTMLSFVYTSRYGVRQGGNILTATALEANGGSISAQQLQPGVDSYTTGIITLTATHRAPLEARQLKIDGIRPTITNISVIGKASNAAYYPWHRAGEEITVEVTTSKPIRVLGAPEFLLMFNGTGTGSANFQGMKEGSSNVIVFNYRIKEGDNTDNPDRVRYNAGTCFSVAHSQSITDTVSAMGNYLVLSTSTTQSVSGVGVDTSKPAALNVVPRNNDTTTIRRFRVEGTRESGAEVQYARYGVDWTRIIAPGATGSLPYNLPEIETSGSSQFYVVAARQIDRAGNESDEGEKQEFSLGSDCELSGIISDNSDTPIIAGGTLSFKLVFSSPVYTDGTASITFYGGGSGDTGNTTVNIVPVSKANANLILSANRTIPSGEVMNPVRVRSLVLTGVKNSQDDSAAKVSNAQNVIDAFHSARPSAPIVMAKAPTITSTVPSGNTGSLAVTNGNESVLQLNFSHEVFPESGNITIKPYTSPTNSSTTWRVPPVLSNTEFSQILDSLSSTQQTSLNSFYKATTHGLKQEGGRFVPDTSTKYVLNFSENLNNGTVRTLLNTAKYNVQEVESVNPSRVKASGGGAWPGGGTKEVYVHLDKLPEGQRWKIEIDEGAFRDAAGNQFAGLSTSSDYYFWSADTSAPVIRVDRTSNNSRNGTMENTNPLLRANTRFRIDSQTPDAVISYATSYNVGIDGNTTGVSTVSNATAHNNIYRPNTEDGQQNSSIPNALVTVINGYTLSNTITAAAQDTQTGTWLGDSNARTARKDYIVATAQRTQTPSLSASGKAYEGAFKTVIVYRNVGNDQNIKFEGTNLYGGATTIAGFPMSNNVMDGSMSKFAWYNNNDHIWITWEVVVNFWHVGMTVGSATDPQLGTTSWDYFADYQNHSFRKYGNWGLRIDR